MISQLRCHLASIRRSSIRYFHFFCKSCRDIPVLIRNFVFNSLKHFYTLCEEPRIGSACSVSVNQYLAKETITVVIQSFPHVSISGIFSFGTVWQLDRKSTRLNSSHVRISYAVFCLKKKSKTHLTLTYNIPFKLPGC